MATAITCPHCQRLLRTANPIPAGKKVRCPSCSSVFVVPGDADDEPSAAFRPATAAEPHSTRRRRPDDDIDEDDRPRSRRSRDVAFDDGEPPRRRLRKRSRQPNLALILSITAAGVLLLAAFLVTAFAVPGFLLPRGGADAQLLKHIPPDANIVGFVDVAAGRNRDQQTAQAMDAAVDQLLTFPALQELPELRKSIKAIDKALLAANVDREQLFVLLHTQVPFQKKDLVRLVNGQEAGAYIKADLGGKAALLATPDDKTVLLGVMPETAFAAAVSSSGARLPPELQNEIDRVVGATFWGVALINGKMQMQLQQMPVQALQAVGGGNAVPALQRLRCVSLAQYAPPGNGSSVAMHAAFANDADAESVRSFTQDLWDSKGKGMVGMLNTVGLFARDNETGKAFNSLADDLIKTFQLSRNGTVVSASITITEPTYAALQKAQQNAMAGGFAFPGMGGPGFGNLGVPHQVGNLAAARTAALRVQSATNLRQIGIAFHAHNDAHKRLPQQAITDAQGKPLLSWRVAILPFIGQQNLYAQFDVKLPWDHPHNMKLVEQMPKIYAPVGKNEGKGLTYYQVFTGPGTVFDAGQPTPPRLQQIRDGTSNTIAAVEAGQPVLWTKPEDLPYDPKAPLPQIGGQLSDGFNVLMFDGAVHFKRKNLTDEALRRAIECADGQALHPAWFAAAQGQFTPRPTRVPPFVGQMVRNEIGLLDGGQQLPFTIELEQGVAYVIDLKGPGMDPVIEVHDDTGRKLAEDDDGGEGLNSRLRFVPPRTASYRVIVRDLRNRGGNFTLTVQK